MIDKWIGRYKLSGEIGFGGMGSVFQAIDSDTEQLVAVKLLSPEYLDDLGLRTAFEREAHLVTNLSHEAIVPIYSLGQEGGQPYLVMQYMTHGSLADRLHRGGLAPEELAPILDRVCSAIDYAHANGIIHRDLKPSNILFDERDQAYLADFGIAWQPSLHRATSPIEGTPAYLSPEQALGEEEIDGRCDIYALGIILFEALTGKLPFESQLPFAVILKQIHDQAPSLRSVNRDLPVALDEIVQRALAKAPDDRFASAEELSNAYHQALSSKPDSRTRNEYQAEGQTMPGSAVEQDASNFNTSQTIDDQIASQTDPLEDPGLTAPDRIDFWGAYQASTAGKWRVNHLMALGLMTFLGILLAAGLTAFLRLPLLAAPVSDTIEGIMLSYDRTSFVLANHTRTPTDLSGLSFRRNAVDDDTSPEFSVSDWEEKLGLQGLTLQPGNCFQLLLPNAPSYSLKPGKPFPNVSGCDDTQEWLVLSEPHSWFWVSEGEQDSFVVLIDGAVVQTCAAAQGSCLIRSQNP